MITILSRFNPSLSIALWNFKLSLYSLEFKCESPMMRFGPNHGSPIDSIALFLFISVNGIRGAGLIHPQD